MNKALVLGGGGFIGTALILRLSALGVDVTAVDRCWSPSKPPSGVHYVTGDVFDRSCLDDVMPNQDMVFHLVSTTIPDSSNKSPLFDCETNTIGALRILDAMIENGVGRIVFSSSGGTVYGIPQSLPIQESAPTFPISAYGVSKLSVEKYLYLYSYLHGIKATILRLSNPFGPGQVPEKGQGAIATFAIRALHGEAIDIWGDGSIVRDYIYIDDVIEAFIAAEKIDKRFAILNIGSGQGKSLLEVIATIERELGKKISVNYKSSRPCDVPKVVLNIRYAASEMGWKPACAFEEGVKRVIAHMRLV